MGPETARARNRLSPVAVHRAGFEEVAERRWNPLEIEGSGAAPGG